MKTHVKRAIIRAEEAISDIIDDQFFTTSKPEVVAALLGATRRLITEVKNA